MTSTTTHRPPIREYPSVPPTAAALSKVRPLSRRPRPASSEQPDEAVQTVIAPAVSATINLNFDGIGDSANGSLAGVPPDSNLAVGATQVVEVINTSYQVYDK